MNLFEIVDQRDLKLKELESLTSTIKIEKRKFNEEETSTFNTIKEDVERLNKQIEDIRKSDTELRNVSVSQKNNEKKMATNFSLLKTIRDIVEGRSMSEETQEILNAGRQSFSKAGLSHRGQIVIPHEYRDQIIVTQATLGQEVVAEDKI